MLWLAPGGKGDGSGTKEGTHLDGAVDLRGLDVAAGIEGAGDPLHNVHKDLIAPAAIRAASVQHRLDDACRALRSPWQKPAVFKPLQAHLCCEGTGADAF